MQRTIITSLFFAFLFSNCTNHSESHIKENLFVDTIAYPESAYICFDRQQERRRKKEFKLGDSCAAYAKYFDLNCVDYKNSTYFYQVLETRGKFGTTITTIWFDLDKQKKLLSFKAEWSHKSSSNNSARKEFYDVVLSNALSCLWEDTINIYKSKDTLLKVFFDQHIEEVTSDFSGENWIIKYQCRLR